MEPMIGEIRMFGGNFAPRGWALCNGQLMSISQNNALFSLLGTIYGGDGRTTYGLPDLRGRCALHSGNGPGLTERRLGSKSGTAIVTLTTNELPSHTHSLAIDAKINVTDANGTSDEAPDQMLATAVTSTNDASKIYHTGTGNEEYRAGEVQVAATISNDGGSQYHNNLQPYLTVNYIIALVGIYPSRS